MHTERAAVALKGTWRDRYEYSDGRVIVTPWVSNQIQNLSADIVAALLARAGETAFPGFAGIAYMGVGSGDVSWDATPPTQSRADTTLTTEYFRKAIADTDMYFINPADPPGGAPVAGPTRKIGIPVTLLSSEANGAMREFGLFAGLATATLDSGLILNWVVHPLINKDTTLTLTRTVELEILEPT